MWRAFAFVLAFGLGALSVHELTVSGGTSWIGWLEVVMTFAVFGFALTVPQYEMHYDNRNGFGAGGMYTHHQFDRRYGAGGGIPYGAQTSWPFSGVSSTPEQEILAAGKFAGIGPRGHRRSDERIKDEIVEWFTHNGELDASGIEVRVIDGTVILDGTVPDRKSRRLAEHLAERVSGVNDLQNDLRMTSEPGASSEPNPIRAV